MIDREKDFLKSKLPRNLVFPLQGEFFFRKKQLKQPYAKYYMGRKSILQRQNGLFRLCINGKRITIYAKVYLLKNRYIGHFVHLFEF